MAEIEESTGTLTRRELLQQRGYDPATVAGNGHEPDILTTSTTAAVPPPAERRCQGCGASLAGKQASARWCSQSCKHRANYVSTKAAAAPDRALAEVSTPGYDRLAALAAALCGQGLRVVVKVDSFELVVG